MEDCVKPVVNVERRVDVLFDEGVWHINEGNEIPERQAIVVTDNFMEKIVSTIQF